MCIEAARGRGKCRVRSAPSHCKFPVYPRKNSEADPPCACASVEIFGSLFEHVFAKKHLRVRVGLTGAAVQAALDTSLTTLNADDTTPSTCYVER